jgi:Fur family ferric uptake transcriptional regulator
MASVAPPATAALHSRVREEFEAYLATRGYRLTRQRRIILEAVFAAGPHVDAEQILKEARKVDVTLALATVYRTLILMTEGGILAERHFGADRRSFEIVAGNSEHHDHLICKGCGRVFEFFEPEIERIQDLIAQKLGFELVGHRLELFGKCKGCADPRCEELKKSCEFSPSGQKRLKRSK